jgi:hypothetical protein
MAILIVLKVFLAAIAPVHDMVVAPRSLIALRTLRGGADPLSRSVA